MRASVIFESRREWGDFGVLALRLGLAVLVFFAGITKFVGTLPIGTLVVFTQAGIPEETAQPLVSTVGVLEILVGLSLVGGLLVRLAALPILAINIWVLAFAWVFQSIFASVFEGAGQPAALGADLALFFAMKDVAIIGAALLLLIYGAGRYSLDAHIAARLRRPAGK